MEHVEDLAARWVRARRAALTAVVAGEVELGEDDLLPLALGVDRDATERRAFDHSRRLAESFCRFHGTQIPLADLPEALERIAALGSPCLAGTWTAVPGEAAVRLERDGCAMRAQGPAVCDYWREAVSGLVLGLTGGLRHARHDSRGHGGARCVDIIYTNPESALRFGPIPDELRDGLAAVARTVAIFDSSVTVRYRGISEGVLYYELEQAGCGGGTLGVRPMFEQSVQRRFPALSLREISPRPVLEDS